MFLSLCTGVHAQVDQGAITGVVQDPTGAVIPNAHVTLSNTDTGLRIEGQSNANGVYVFSPVKIGNYTLAASAPGFQTTLQQHLHLDLQQRLNIALTLQFGSVTESVTVSGGLPAFRKHARQRHR
jgi:hypothetical protein